ncbi:ABC transporter permease [Gordonia sp. ABSL1-1]|uniref:ABC transporter permease n=1 Tax=Gordonia sp. ABSL1-1 TaxID=3053923 RepID=UPI002573FE07|nr:ABC transporter permease [Gordonia sp. ABSL1-1]MDL9937287.1 ABC transporter permease [Gordonia sp. ABSL1-1]
MTTWNPRTLTRRIGRYPAAVLTAGAVLLAIVVAAVGAPLFAPEGYDAQDITARYSAPTWFGRHPLGTDELGRDVLVRAVYGGQSALGITVLAAVLATLLGLTLALVAALGRRWVDDLVGRLADVQLAIPSILLALVVLAFAGNEIVPLIVVLAVGAWVLTFRIVRVHATRIAALPYVEAARISGAGWWGVLRRHVLPASLPLVVVAFTLNFSSILVLESSLGYLGLGIQPPRPDWGQMVSSGQAQLAGAWWISIVPGVFLVATVVSVQVIGDWLADRLSVNGSGGPTEVSAGPENLIEGGRG